MHLRRIRRISHGQNRTLYSGQKAERRRKDVQIRPKSIMELFLHRGGSRFGHSRNMLFFKSFHGDFQDSALLCDSVAVSALRFQKVSNFQQLLLVFNVIFVSLRPGNFAGRNSGASGSIFMI